MTIRNGKSDIESAELDILLGRIPNTTVTATSSTPGEKRGGSISVQNRPTHVNVNIDDARNIKPREEAIADGVSNIYSFHNNGNGVALETSSAASSGKIVEIPDRTLLSNGGQRLKTSSSVSAVDNSNVVYVPSSCTLDNSNMLQLYVDGSERYHGDAYQPLQAAAYHGHLPAVNAPPITGHPYLLDPHQSHLYLRTQQLQQHEPAWTHMELASRIQQQQYVLYNLQQLHNQQYEALLAGAQSNDTLPSPTLRQYFSDLSISQNSLGQPSIQRSHHLHPNCKAPGSRNAGQIHQAYQSNCLGRQQVLDRVGRQNFPEKILTRSHGVNSLRYTRPSSSTEQQTSDIFDQNGRAYRNRNLLGLSRITSGPGNSNFGSTQIQAPPLSSSTLKQEDLRGNFQKYSSLEELTGRIHLAAMDQHGCRFLQGKFAEGSRKDVDLIFDGILSHIVDLMIDSFGNYLVQKLLDVIDEDQRMQILVSITKKPGELVRISCDMHGTRAVQKIVETLRTPEQSAIFVSSLKPGVAALIKNMNGNHVVHRCLQYLLPQYKEFIFEASILNLVDLATDRHGCVVLQKCLTHSDAEHRRHLIHEITVNAAILSQDPFGNYVVQFVLELGIPWATIDVVAQLENSYSEMSVQKYSSNVVEKCLKFAGEVCGSHIVEELIKSGRIDQIMQDPYGNYVIQAALQYSKGATHAVLVEAIRPHIPVLRTSPYGKKVLSSNAFKK